MGPRLIAAVLGLLSAAPAFAQEVPTERQRELNRLAYEAMQGGDAARAIALYDESLAIGALNVTYLNLGRAHQKVGNCAEAWDAFDRVAGAPAVAKPPPEAIAETHRRFVAELAGDCPTRLAVSCENEGAQVAVAGDSRSCPATFDVTPGKHVVRMSWRTVSVEAEAYAAPGRDTEVGFRREPEPPVEVPPAELPPPPVVQPATSDVVVQHAFDRIDWGALALLGTSGVLFVGAVLLDGVIPLWPAYAHDRRVTGADFIPVGGYTLSLAALVAGILDLADGPER